MSRKVIVTGACGFIGRHVSKHCAEQGLYVTGIGHSKWSRGEWDSWGISNWVSDDITVDALSSLAIEPDVIFHCAGSGSVANSFTRPFDDFNRNVDTVAAVLEFVRKKSASTIVILPSSAAVYGKVKNLPISEHADLNPVSPYGENKRIAEQLCSMYANHFDVKVVIVRLFSAYGPYLRKQLLWDACEKMTAGDLSFSGSGKEIRDWLNVSDISRLFMSIAKAGESIKENPVIVNGGTGTGASVVNILSSIKHHLNITEELEFDSKARAGDPDSYIADIGLIKDLTGWAPEVDLEDGIQQYVNWYRQAAE